MTTDGTGGGARGNSNPNAKIRFAAIGEAWALVRARLGTWMLISLLCFLIPNVISFVVQYVPLLVGWMRPTSTGDIPPALSVPARLVDLILEAFLTAGCFNVALKQVRGTRISVGDLFGAGRFTGAAFVGTLVYRVAMGVGLVFLVIPGLLVAGGLMLTLPLIVDQNLSGKTAANLSWKTLWRQSPAAFGFVVYATLLSAVGIIGLGVGVLCTAPILCVSIAVVYQDFLGSASEPVSQIQMPLPPTSGYLLQPSFEIYDWFPSWPTSS